MARNNGILLLGAGGHCLSVLDSLVSLNIYEKIGLVVKDRNNLEEASAITDRFKGIHIAGTDEDLPALFAEGYADAFITVGSIGNPLIRQKLYRKIKQIGFHIPNIIDKTAVVSPDVRLGEGIFVGKKAVVNTGSNIGNCVIINTMALIEHECSVEDFVHVAPGCILCGGVRVGENTHIGAGSIIKQGLTIGSDTMIGMGSVVVSPVGSHATAYGNPCKEVKHE